MKRLVAVLLVAGIVALPQKGRAADPLARVVNGATFDQFVGQTLRAYGVPGAVVAIVTSNGPTFVKGYGVRKSGESAPVNEDTRLQIASMSKFVAASAVGTVVDRGAIGWDQPIRSFNPDLAMAEPYATKWVTLRDFFAHRSGLPAYGGDILTRLGLSTAQLVNRARYLSFDHSFRELWAYSNYGIFLAQESAAHTVGLSPSELLQQTILTLGSYAGTCVSPLYGRLVVSNDGGSLTAAIGPNGYRGHLLHYSGDAFLLWFDDAGVDPGLVTFTFDRNDKVIEVNGSTIPGSFTTNYGHFVRMAATSPSNVP